MSFSWDFLICIKFCALRAVGLYIKFHDLQCLPVYGDCSPLVLPFKRNLEFDSLNRIGNWFNYLLLVLLRHIRSKIYRRKL